MAPDPDPNPNPAASRLPDGLQLVAVLSTDGRVLRVARGDEDLVLRWVDDPAVLRAEWASLARVRHPVVAAPLEWGEAGDGRAYVLRAFVPGQTLDSALAHATPKRAAHWIDDLLAGLEALHAAGLVHRDVKAANVVVDQESAHLLDLELVHSAHTAGEVAGTLYHVAPEVLTGGRHGPRADLFSLGVTLALAHCGTPSTSFGRRFPSSSFWEAARLDPQQLPEELAALTRALVMRRPEERPSSAAAAREFLPGGTKRVPPPLELPPLAGRAEMLHGWMEGGGLEHDLLVVGVPDPEELEAAAAELRLAAACEGRRTVPLHALDEVDLRALAPASGGGPDLVVVQGAPFSPVAVSEVVFDLLDGAPSSGVGTLVLSLELADRARVLISSGLSAAEARRVRWQRLPRVELATLTTHLERLSEGSSPRAAETLARDLLERTGGRQSDLDLCLARAVAAEVVRPVRGGYALLRETWPAERREARAECLRELPAQCAELLLAMGCVPGVGAERLGQVAGMGADDVGLAMAGLRDVGALATGGDTRGRALLAGAAWVEAAEEALPVSTRSALVARARRALEESGAEAGLLASVELRAASTEEELAAVLASAESVRRTGRLAEARSLAQGVSQRAQRDSRPTAGRDATTLLARLDIGQSDAAAAGARLARLHGEELARADREALLVGAEAAELEGRRGAARGFYERVTASSDATPEQRLRALIGLGYGRLLDGDPAGALQVTQGHPSREDADEPAGTLQNLRLGALAQLGRFDEAQELLDLARERAGACGDPTLLGRTELNRGFLDRRRGRLGSAAEALLAATAAFGRTDNVKMRALAVNNSGVLQRDLGNLVTAGAMLEQGLRLRRRLADTYGAASSRGSLAVVVLESGKVGRALAELQDAEREMAAGQHEAERAFLDAHRALALSLAGSAVEARGMMEGEHWQRARAAHPLLTARAEALAWLAEGRREQAAEHLRRACQEAPREADVAELVRSSSLLCALDPGSHTGREALLSACGRVGSDSRLAEGQWRTRSRGAPVGAGDLQEWLEVFEAAGRTDLIRVVALELAVVHERDGRRAARRTAMATAEAAAEALVDGLDREQAERSLRLLELVAGGSGREPSAAALSADWFLACNRAMASCQDLEELLTNIIDMALEVTEGRRGFLVLMREGRALARVARGMESENLAEEQQRFSTSVVREAIADGAPIVCLDAAADDRFANMQSVRDLALRSVLCQPLAGEGDFEGAIYVDNDRSDSMFDERDVEAVRALADQASIAIRELRRRKEIEQLNARLQERVDYQAQEIEHARERLEKTGDKLPIGGMIGESQSLRRVQELVQRLAPTDLPVLVTGPSGAGKDLVARALHEHSQHASGPFVAENVAALPESLVESALFGHVRGAFTGAGRDHRGLFEEAHGGTFFLDEIGDLPPAVQAKLLRVLESGEVRPLGGGSVLRVDVRIVAATNRPLASMVEEGTFRRDLFYRLNAGEIAVPSLAERVEDVPLLVEHFLRRLCREHDRPLEMSSAVLAALVSRSWPGEIRELANEVARLFFLADVRIDQPDQVRPPSDVGSAEPMPASFELDAVERAAILRALRAVDGSRTSAAKLLGISRAGLYTKLKRLGLESKG